MRYIGKKILVTGASSGLGKMIAKQYAKEGGKIKNISRDKNKMEILNKELNLLNGLKNHYYSRDVSKYDEIITLREDLKNKNLIPDIVVNNAAGNFLCPIEKISKNGWQRIIDIVLNGTFNITHIIGKEMIKRKSGIFLNISTTYSETSSALVIPSAVAKSGVDTLMKGLTVEWSDYNIRFVGIAPGPIEGSGGMYILDKFGIYSKMNNYLNPSKRMGTQEEIAKLGLYLTSDDASYINGEIVRIDGGELNKNSGEFNFITNIPYYKKLI